jgi:Uncharacterised nucleotidyltransferase
VLTDRCRRVLTAARLDALPATLRARAELAALRYAVGLADGDRRAPGRQAYLATMAWNLARLERLETVLTAARAAGLRLMPLKGALLLRTHYGDPGARMMVDVDVACAPAELPRVLELCRDLGFDRVDPPAFRRAKDAVHDVKLLRGGVTIELHHRLWHELRIAPDVEPLLARATEVPYGETTAWAPTEADHLYVVMVHAATHGFTGNPLWMTDAGLLCDGADPSQWARVQALAAASGARVALAAARDHLRTTLPWIDLPGGDVAPVRRAMLRRMAPWLQRGEGALGVWGSRLVRPLLFDRARDFGSWALEKLAMWGKE